MQNLTDMSELSKRDIIVNTLEGKSSMKQDVYDNTLKGFQKFKSSLKELAENLQERIGDKDKRLDVEYLERGDFEAELKIAGDVLIFYMHTNIFKLDPEHGVSKSAYCSEDDLRRYCGTISVYNFLADSLKYSRVNDLGYMIARVFVNKEEQFFVEGKGRLGFLYEDFQANAFSSEVITGLVESIMLHTLEFDLVNPPFGEVQAVTVHEILEATKFMSLSTGKRIGYAFQSENDPDE